MSQEGGFLREYTCFSREQSCFSQDPGGFLREQTCFSRMPSTFSRGVSTCSRGMSCDPEFERQASQIPTSITLYTALSAEAVPAHEGTDIVCDGVQRCCETGNEEDLASAQKLLDEQLKLGALHFEALVAGLRCPCLVETTGEVERIVVRTSSSGVEHVQYRYSRKLANVRCFDWLCCAMSARFGSAPGHVVDALLAVEDIKATLRREVPAMPSEKKSRHDEITIEEESDRAVTSWMDWLLDSALHSFAVGDVADDEFERLVFELDHSNVPAGHVAALNDEAQVMMVDKAIKAGNVKWFTAERLGALRNDAGLSAAEWLLRRTSSLRRDVAEAAASAAVACAN